LNNDNILIDFLKILKVKHTFSFSNKYYWEHPHRNNLYGLSKMLSDYGIENAATRIDDKEKDILNIETPFIAQFGGDFVTVYHVDVSKVSFLWKGLDHVLPVSNFLDAWSGVVLLAEISEKSIEPDYQKHKEKDRLNFLNKAFFFSSCGFIFVWACMNNMLYSSSLSVTQLFGYSIIICINLTGAYVGYLLVLKQMNIQSRNADKICSLLKQNNCNNILETKAAKLFGMIGWSEIGLGYFATNVMLLLFSPQTVYLIALINIITLPYSFWSVWYQKVKVQQWCVLCLLVQVLLWTIFIINGLFGYIQMSALHFQVLFDLMLLGSCYSAMILGISALVPKFNSDRQIPYLRQTLSSIKADEHVFSALQKQQPFYETNDSDSMIRFGNPDSSIQLTVLTNPYCDPCSRMHKRIERLLQKADNNWSVQYILSSFDESLNTTNKYLIAACLENKNNAGQIFTDWFEKGKELKDDYFKEMNFKTDHPEIEAEFQKHEMWRKKTQIGATPTILVNGYHLSEIYKIEDLQCFTEFGLFHNPP